MAYRESADPVADVYQKQRDYSWAAEARVWISLGTSTVLASVSALAFGSDPWRVVGYVCGAWSALVIVRAANALLSGGW